ncbi:MAG: GAF domain-containing protein [Anaerolineae bacterium]|nr:GAF domain-containing protein [Anaerolineae bacterium]
MPFVLILGEVCSFYASSRVATIFIMREQAVSQFLSEISPGFLQFGSARMALLDIEAGFWGIRRQVEALIGFRLTNSVLQQAGANGGASFAASFGTTKDIAEQERLFKSCVQAYQLAGFGQFGIAESNWSVGRIVIRAEDTFEAWMTGRHAQKVSEPVCAYTAGVLVGFINVICDRQDVVCIEHRCQAKGDDVCEFELLPVSEAGEQNVVAFTPDPMLGRQLNLLEMLFERMPMGIAVIDREFKLVRCNPTWATFIEQYTPSTAAHVVPGTKIFDLEPGTEETLIPLFDRVFNGETIRQDAVRIESGGIASFWDIVLSPLYDEDQIVGLLNVSTDATERVMIQQTLEQRVEERTREIERRREIAESLRDILRMINSNLPLDSFIERAVKLAALRMDAAACVLHQFNRTDQTILHLAGYGIEGIFPGNRTRPFAAMKSSGGYDYLQATLQRQPTYQNYPPLPERIDEIKRDPSIPENIKAERIAVRGRFAASLSVPLVIQDEVFGGMVFYYSDPQEFPEEQIQLALTFADQVALALENARLHQREQQRQRELQTLLDVAGAANGSLNLDETLKTTLDLLVNLTNASRAGVMLRNESTGRLEARMLRPEQTISSDDLARISQACESVAASGEPVYVMPDAEQGFVEPGALLPLRLRDRILGVLVIIGAEGERFNPGQQALFKSIADQLSVAVENARLYGQAEQAAIASERNRLARDLHDAVSQTLFSASLIADVLPKLWERDPEIGKRKLDELRVLTRGALAEMRTLLLELRPSSLIELDLADLLRHLSNAFTGRTRIPLALNVEGLADPPLEVKEAVYRVVQESLNNINKHAQASRVFIDLHRSEDHIQLDIRDDGCGFDAGNISHESLGLGIMRERAESIGAQFFIQTGIGAGTRIELIWKDGQP